MSARSDVLWRIADCAPIRIARLVNRQHSGTTGCCAAWHGEAGARLLDRLLTILSSPSRNPYSRRKSPLSREHTSPPASAGPSKVLVPCLNCLKKLLPENARAER